MSVGRTSVSRALAVLALAVVCLPGASAAATCEELVTTALPGAEITGAALVARGAFLPPEGRVTDAAAARFAALPAFCRVTATLRPSSDSDIRIEVWMPAESWNGKFLAVGNGTWAGVVPYTSLAGGLRAGYATAGTDAGHVGDTAAFAPGHPDRMIDMAYRAVHEMTVAGKALVTSFYGGVPTLSLWSGCSTGGRQGIAAAARYPMDFDAVVAGAPAVNWMRLHAGRIALNQAVNRTPAHVILPETYAAIGTAVVQACDALDGVADGVLENPRACRFDPAVLACRAGGPGGNCLTAAQVESARSFYAPVRHPVSGATIMPGLEPGSERLWGILGGARPLGTAVEAFRYGVFKDAGWDWRRFNLASDLGLANTREELTALDTSETDLRAFFDRGGKLLLYHGWNDPQIPPGNTIDFFERVLATSRTGAAGRSVQLYMVPGMEHCGGGVGADLFDSVGALNAWLATGHAPARIPAARIVNGLMERTRPLCPFGQVARWNGVGSTSDAASFACVAVSTPSSDSR